MKILNITLKVSVLYCIAMVSLFSQLSLQEKLGYAAEDKLLIIHADDLGLSHSQNKASLLAMEVGMVSSGSIMMPCPWVSEVADYAGRHPGLDLGLHLTVTSEWKTMKWGPVAPRGQVSTLTDSLGHFFTECQDFAKHADAQEVEAELRAQIDKAILMGINPTHLDTHMGCMVYASPEVFGVYLKLAREYRIPCMMDRFSLNFVPKDLKDYLHPDDIMIDRIYSASPADAVDMPAYYDGIIKNLTPGVNTILIHLAYNDSEMQALTIDHPDWGAKWRQEDLHYFTSERCRKILEENNIKLITWRQIKEIAFKN